jgi:uncharacterized protein
MLDRVYKSPYNTDWHQSIAECNTILRTRVGSGLHGVTIDAAERTP